MVTFQIVVCGLSLSEETSAEWGIVVVGLTHGGTDGRAYVLADESGRMSGAEMAYKLAKLGGRVMVAPVAAPAEKRASALLRLIAIDGAIVPPTYEVEIGDAAGMWTAGLKLLYESGRLVHGGEFEDLERTLRSYQPKGDSPRVAALLAAVTYLQAIGGLSAGTTWAEPVRSPGLAEALAVGQAEGWQTISNLGLRAAKGEI